MTLRQRINRFQTRFIHLIHGKGWKGACDFEGMRSCSHCREGFNAWCRDEEERKSNQQGND